MEIVVKWVVIAVCGYLLGNLNVAVAISQAFMGRDIRKQGSGNAGATNMTRVYGWGAGAVTLGGDMLKTVMACLVGQFILGDTGLCIGGIAAMLGHCFPLLHNLKGGKGIAAGAALGLMIDWRVFVVIILAFVIVALLTRKVSLGSIAASVMIAVASAAFGVSTPRLVLAIVAMCIALFCHRGNIKRLIEGTEPDFRAGRAKKAAKLGENPAPEDGADAPESDS